MEANTGVLTAGATAPSVHDKTTHRLAGWSSMVGTTIEWYDFFLYGTAAALIFNKVFFPSLDAMTGTIASFSTFAIGFVSRPLGGMVCGHFGDKLGRKSMLLATIFMMGIPSTLIGLIPSYDSIGYWAAVLLVIMRFIQGLAVGGEWGGAVLMAVEHAPEGKKGLYGSLPQMGVGGGLVMSSLMMALVSKLPEEALFSWGWRIPFLLSIVLLGVGVFIRLKVPESPEFEKMKEEGHEVKAPILVVIREHWDGILKIVGARVVENTWFYVVVTFSLAYAVNQLNLPRAELLSAITVGAALTLVTMPFFGWLSDKIGARFQFGIGVVIVAMYATPFFTMLATKDITMAWWAIVIGLAGVFPILYAPESILFCNQFPSEVRYSGISVSAQVAGLFGGGLAPIAATWLLAQNGGDPRLVIYYLVALSVLALVCTVLMRKEAP